LRALRLRHGDSFDQKPHGESELADDGWREQDALARPLWSSTRRLAKLSSM
jgi:hypothetical protein